tara:strand:- start:2474 stop:3232 length:759 start_codon:yes stop_codon:yes gene_type:complete
MVKKNSKLRSQIVNLKHDDPTRTLQSIGEEVGVTRERVRQILKLEGLDTLYPTKEYQALRANLALYCTQCNVEIPTKDYTSRTQGLCYEHRTLKRQQEIYETVQCPQCQKKWSMRKKEVWTRQVRKHAYKNDSTAPSQPFCSKKCTAQYYQAGVAYGFGSEKDYHNCFGVMRRKLTPEIAVFCSQLLAQNMSYSKIAAEIKDAFGIDVAAGTIGSWKKRGIVHATATEASIMQEWSFRYPSKHNIQPQEVLE